MADEQPWITYDVIDFLKRELKNSFKVFEYGGGGSTLFFLTYAKEIVTVEHDKEWFALLSETIGKKSINWTGMLIERQTGDLVNNPDKADPDHYSSDDAKSFGFNYKDYASYIDHFPNDHFDVILVDGRSRPSCIKHSIAKLKKGGFLILDNSDRDYYLTHLTEIINAKFTTIVDTPGACGYCWEFTKTSVWRKK